LVLQRHDGHRLPRSRVVGSAGTGSIAKEAFHSDKVPTQATVFKDPAKLRSRIYVNDAGKEAIEKIVAETGLSGLVVTEPGST